MIHRTVVGRLVAQLVLSLAIAAAPAWGQRAPRSLPRALPSGTTCYEVFVRSFADSDGDGIGDLRGLMQRFDYINDGRHNPNTSLGATCIWLMPIMASPSYHGYDISDYYRVQPAYGTLDDVKRLVALAHRRGVRVLLDMVINHVSSEHPWFQTALRDSASRERALFRFAAKPGPNNRWGDNNWRKSPLRDEYYFAFFWQGMPDLNYDGDAALVEMQRVATWWLRETGIDGFRMDAVKFLAEDGARVDDTPRTHEVLRQYAAHVRATSARAFTIGEVFDSTGSLLTYYPDQLDSYFAFEVADSIIAGVRRGDARGILAPVLRLQSAVPGARWGTFLRNHDQPRTVTELGDDLTKAKLAATIQLTLPGLPFVYYGEELGMHGPKPDERVRTPMAWSTTSAHAGFSASAPWEPLGDDSLTANVAAQTVNSSSLLQHYRRLVHLRATSRALADGTLKPLASSASVLAYVRKLGTSSVLIVANVSDREVTPTVSASDGTLPNGRVRLRDLLVGGDSWTARVQLNGTTRSLVLPRALPARTALVLSLDRAQ